MEIKKTISDWAKGIFSGFFRSYKANIKDLPAAPPFLSTGHSGPGYCITIKPVSTFLLSASAFASPTSYSPRATTASPQLGFWIPASGSQGSQCTMREGDEEILTYAVDWSKATRTDAATGEQAALANEDALVENLTSLFAEFLRDDILLPALEKHLDDNGIAHEPFTVDMVGGIEPWDEKNWTFVFLPESTRNQLLAIRHGGNAASVIGVTGDGRAALFSYSRHEVEPRGYVDHINLESQASGIDSPVALQSWLEDTLPAISLNNN